MAEPIEDEPDADRVSDPDTQMMRRQLSQKISGRRGFLDGLGGKSNTPRMTATVCDVVYETPLGGTDDSTALDSTAELQRQARTSQERKKLVIILCGLPGRGKTYLCNKLLCYLNWCAARWCSFGEGFSELPAVSPSPRVRSAMSTVSALQSC